MSSPATTKAASILERGPSDKTRSRRPMVAAGIRAFRSIERYGQVAPPFESAAVLSPLPQIVNVPIAVLVYL